MTDRHEETNEDKATAERAAKQQELLNLTGDDEFEDDDDSGLLSEDGDSPAGELSPNDIFGLDPLDVLTLEELADYLKISTPAAHRAIKEQKLPGRNIGGEWRFLRDAVANWLRCQEAPIQQQQKARDDYSKSKPATPEGDHDRYSRPPRTQFQAEPKRPYQSESTGGEYRPRQRFPEGGQQYGNQGAGQYGSRPGQYGGGQGGGGQTGGVQGGGGQYGGGNYGGGYTPPPRRPFRAEEGGQGGYAGGGQFSGGGYQGGGQRFGGGPKRKNKRQVFDNERGKRLDKRKEGEFSEGDES